MNTQRYKYRPAMRQKRPKTGNPRLSKPARQLIEQIDLCRISSGIKYSDLTEQIGETSGGVGNFLNLRSDPSLSRFLRYAEAVGFEVKLVPKVSDPT